MASNTDESDMSEDTDPEVSEQTARKIDGFQERVSSKANVITPENTELMKHGIKLSFAVLLTTLLFYWGVAYYFDIILFEF